MLPSSRRELGVLSSLYMSLVENKKAYHDFEILEEYEGGIVLLGHEVKSVTLGRASLRGSHVVVRGGDLFILGMTIPPYQIGNTPKDYEPDRPRKLLLHKYQIDTLIGKGQTKGLTIIPLRVYTKGTKVKLAFAVARGKKTHDKRETLKKREASRDIARSLKKSQ